MLGAFPASAQTPIDEAQLKAGFVFRFAQFVEWPEEALAGRDTIDLCVMGPGTYRNALDHLANGETLGGRPLTVRAATTSTVDKCHLLFLPREAPSRRDLLARVADHPVLTVGDDPRFLDDGGIVLLRVVGSHVRFEINAAAARRAALRLSAQLLRLAMTVHGGAP